MHVASDGYHVIIIAGLISQSLQLQARRRVRVHKCVYEVEAVQVLVFVCLRSSRNHMTEVGGP